MDVSVDQIKPGFIIEFTDKTNEYYGRQAVILHFNYRSPFVRILTGEGVGTEGSIGEMPYKIVSNGEWDV